MALAAVLAALILLEARDVLECLLEELALAVFLVDGVDSFPVVDSLSVGLRILVVEADKCWVELVDLPEEVEDILLVIFAPLIIEAVREVVESFFVELSALLDVFTAFASVVRRVELDNIGAPRITEVAFLVEDTALLDVLTTCPWAETLAVLVIFSDVPFAVVFLLEVLTLVEAFRGTNIVLMVVSIGSELDDATRSLRSSL